MGTRRARHRLHGVVADRLAVTGVLLVGGASERFGSPKALATIRGETLAERAWRVLAAVCDEVLAVGKVHDALELPFDVVDDGEDERAPVFGVIAGLRAASHEACVVLPVDCPLVTPELLRGLAAAHAVPQTGPLPGAYSKGMLEILQERVSRGELSMRGVNAAVVDIDEALVLNVNTPTDLVVATSEALDDELGERPVLPPDDDALQDLATRLLGDRIVGRAPDSQGRCVRRGRRRQWRDEAVGRHAPRVARPLGPSRCSGARSGASGRALG